MTCVNDVWYDNELNYKFGDHKFVLSPNSDGIPIVKCSLCLESRMYLTLMGNVHCTNVLGASK